MAEETQDNGQQQAQPPRMQVLGQFIRDMSFENVAAQAGTEGGQPDIQVQVNLDAAQRPQPNQFNVVMKLTIEAKDKEKGNAIFLLELDYGGIFLVENVPQDQLHPFLLIECPRMLFPFVRRIVHDVTRDGGYPPLNLENIDFLQLYRAEMARRASEEKPN